MICASSGPFRTSVPPLGPATESQSPLRLSDPAERDFHRRPQVSPEVRQVMRTAVLSAKDCPVDRAGRMLVPPDLREFARLQKEVVIAGWLKRFEIWSRDRFTEHYQALRGGFDERALGEFGL